MATAELRATLRTRPGFVVAATVYGFALDRHAPLWLLRALRWVLYSRVAMTTPGGRPLGTLNGR